MCFLLQNSEKTRANLITALGNINKMPVALLSSSNTIFTFYKYTAQQLANNVACENIKYLI